MSSALSSPVAATDWIDQTPARLNCHRHSILFLASVLIGAIGATVANTAVVFQSRLPLDDGLDIFASHAMSGAVGVMLTGIFAQKSITHSEENRQQLVNAGSIPFLVSLLLSPDTDVQYYCTTALSNIAVNATNWKRLAQGKPKLVHHLIGLMDSPSLKVQFQAALALRNLASDEKFQIEIVKCGGLPHLLRLLHSSFLPLILSAADCVRNVSITPQNESPIIEANFLNPLIKLLAYDKNKEIQCHAILTLMNLAASSEKNKEAIVKAGAIE
ncbi:armadillo-type protein [Phakopsora pachyrhizi]|nr:armadillo-type protein [Phakopsora pachyrhizi]